MELEININGMTQSFKSAPKTFLEFEDLLVRTFNLVSLKDCDMKYQDFENDMITISNNEEYTFMLNFFKAQKVEIVHIFIKEKSQILNWNIAKSKYGIFEIFFFILVVFLFFCGFSLKFFIFFFYSYFFPC